MKNKEKKVSVIVPIHNSEKTLSRCIESILRQTYFNLEILLINDGSNDKSLNICNNYASKDSRIIIINKENGGVSSARNMGLISADGYYCCFVDSDDWIESDHIENMVREIGCTDCVVVGYIKDVGKIKTGCHIEPKVYDLSKLQETSICSFFIDGFIHPCWNKLFKTEIIYQNKIVFNNKIAISEDTLFCLDYLSCCKFIKMCDAVSYHYIIDKESMSLSRKVYDDSLDIYNKVYNELDKILLKGNCNESLRNSILIKTIYPQIYSYVLKTIMSRCYSKEKKKELLNKVNKYDYCKYIFENQKKYVNNKYEKLFLQLILFKKFSLLEVILRCIMKVKKIRG